MSSSAAPYNITIDRGSDWSKVLTLSDNNGAPVAITNIFTVAISITGTTSPSVAAASLTYVSADLWTSNGNATVPGSGTWIRVRRSGGAWEITRWVNGVQATGYWTSSSNPNHPAWVETWVAVAGATGSPVVDSAGMFFEGSISLQERGPDVIPFSFDTVGDGSAGQVEISLSRSYTRALANSGAYRFDWFVYHGRERIRLVAGRISAQGSSTGTSTGVPIPSFGSSPSVAWGNIIGTLSDQTDLQAAFDAKQSTLESGTSIKTINGTSLLGSGDVVISGAVSDGDKGSITVSSSGTVWTIDAGAVTNTMLAGSIALSKLATSSTSEATADTLVLRDASGGSTFLELYANAAFIGDLNTSGGIQADGPIIAEAAVTFQATSPITFNSTSYTYGTGAASAHRTALGSGATGDALFTAASASAARTTLGVISRVTTADVYANSTTPVAIPQLTFPVEANKLYKIDFGFAMQSWAAAGYQVTMNHPNLSRTGNGYSQILHSLNIKLVTLGATSTLLNRDTVGNPNGTMGMTGYAYIRPTASGNVTFTTSHQSAGSTLSIGPLAGSGVLVTELYPL